jgi:hypothetical protein
MMFALTLLPHLTAQTAQYQVTIKYYANPVTASDVFSAVKGTGQEYLVLTMQITNSNYTGYNQGFYVDPSAFYLIVNSVRYGDYSATYSLQNPLPVATILPGGTLTGQIAFLVPGIYAQTPNFQPVYQFADTNPTINWVMWNNS